MPHQHEGQHSRGPDSRGGPGAVAAGHGLASPTCPAGAHGPLSPCHRQVGEQHPNAMFCMRRYTASAWSPSPDCGTLLPYGGACPAVWYTPLSFPESAAVTPCLAGINPLAGCKPEGVLVLHTTACCLCAEAEHAATAGAPAGSRGQPVGVPQGGNSGNPAVDVPGMLQSMVADTLRNWRGSGSGAGGDHDAPPGARAFGVQCELLQNSAMDALPWGWAGQGGGAEGAVEDATMQVRRRYARLLEPGSMLCPAACSAHPHLWSAHCCSQHCSAMHRNDVPSA
jgi:hypothetical protein